MKILSTEQIRQADAYTIGNEPVSSAGLMERAANELAFWIIENLPAGERFMIFSGPGNNGGDGLALGRLLEEKGRHTGIYLLSSVTGFSPDTSVNLERLRAMNIDPEIISSEDDFPEIRPSDIIIDSLFGTGLSRPPEGLPAKLIDYLNGSAAAIVSVDIPSGLFGDDNRNNPGNSIIRAKYTLSFEFPKLAFMFAENFKYTGQWKILPIGLHRKFTEEVKTPYYLIEKKDIRPILPRRDRFSHKGNFGHCLLIAGSYGRMGAAALAAGSCLRAGAGLLTVHLPSGGVEILQSVVPEAMVSIDKSETCFTSLPPLENFDAIAAGPASGTTGATCKALHDLLRSVKKPVVLDADAINILAMNKEWMGLIPENSVLTPHPGEFDRLAGKHKTSHDRLITQMSMAKQHKIIVVLKGAFTSVAAPDGSCCFNSSGNPGMATAGSGDVLTGIILSLLGQGYEPARAAVAGVFLHGTAGDLARDEYSEEAMIAGDITSNLGRAFELIKK